MIDKQFTTGLAWLLAQLRRFVKVRISMGAGN